MNRPDMKTFTDLFIRSSEGFSKVSVVLDAFDELRQETRPDLIKFLLQLLTLPQVQIFITTRTSIYKSLCDKFSGEAMEIRAMDDDIENYLDTRLKWREEQIASEYGNWRALKWSIVDTLKCKADGKYV